MIVVEASQLPIYNLGQAFALTTNELSVVFHWFQGGLPAKLSSSSLNLTVKTKHFLTAVFKVRDKL